MEQFEKKYKRMKLKKIAFVCIYYGLMALAFITGLVGMIVCDAKNIDKMISFFAVLGFVLPIVMWVAYLVAIASGKDKAKDKLDSELLESNLSADEVMEIGDKLKLDLFGVAAVKRAKELGIEHLPEGCIRDGILPTKDDLLKSELIKSRALDNLVKKEN